MCTTFKEHPVFMVNCKYHYQNNIGSVRCYQSNVEGELYIYDERQNYIGIGKFDGNILKIESQINTKK